MKTRVKRSIVVASIVAAVVGGLIFADHPIVGLILVVFGVAGAIFMYLASEKSQDHNDEVFDTTARLMFGAGAGNLYTKLILKRVSKVGKHDNVIEDLEKALDLDPNDAEALALYAMVAVLHLSFRHLISGGKAPSIREECQKLDVMIERGIATGLCLEQFYSAKGMMLDIVGAHSTARVYFRQAGQLRSDPYWRLMTSTSYGMEGNYLRALDEMELVMSSGGRDSTAVFYYGRSLSYVGEYAQAIANFKSVVRVRGYFYQLALNMCDAEYFSWHPIRSAYYETIAACCVVRRNWRKALEHIRSAFRHVYWQPIIFASKPFNLATAWISKTFGVSIKRTRHPDEPYFTLGNSLANMRRFLAAQKMFAYAATTSTEESTWLNLCTASIRCEDWPEAERACLHVLQEWPESTMGQEYWQFLSQRTSGEWNVVHGENKII